MKVKIGNRLYSGDEEPIMLILSDDDKFNIGHMDKDTYHYATFPSGHGLSAKQMLEWMNDDGQATNDSDSTDPISYGNRSDS